ncbi:MAG: carboxypeptidase-like regulatory domain-containing protein, partial [Bacteroidota bacterium]|nr:carboxypeptidase-like regulatory domain-containing protein [Bacteroidota bacterium]MDX5431272.1 carboxypeptidase-like regulatory domain-containing protein [Bacteroidota bacterium]MDX5470011.1 carboxypeptidase-like regulatory domain-containing protein [Bacteroidota bacterium]
MKYTLTRTVLFLFSSCIFFLSKAQTGSIGGRLLDSTLSPVSYASVAIFDVRDSSVINFGLSDDRGDFELRGIPLGIPTRLLVSHILYHPYLKNIRLDTAGKLELDTITLHEKSNELTESVITWEAPPIVIRNDTVEFNADAFIGRPGSVVEDLLKKIPGVSIDENGVITYNGRKVSKITIDSKDFFANDPVILLKNIPAKAIDKVQVSKEKDDRGIETDNGEVSINLTLKHWAKKSHFGKAYAGYGTNGRYEAGGLWNLMRDTLQISFIGFGNNLSQAGFSFSDLYQMGGFNRSGISRYTMYSDGRIEANGLNMGGGNGISEAGAAGFNLNYDIPSKLKLNTAYFFGISETNYIEDIQTLRYLGDSTLKFNRIGDNQNNTYSHTFY